MFKKLGALTLITLLSGCHLVHKDDIEQGNIIKPAAVRQLHKGMTEEEVRSIMGNPVLKNIFTPNRRVYVYTFQPGQGKMHETRVTCTFVNGRVESVVWVADQISTP